MRTAKTLIRLGGCPSCSEPSLVANVICWFVMRFGEELYVLQTRESPTIKHFSETKLPNFISPLRARYPSYFSSIAIELNLPCDEFSSIAIELTFVTLKRGLKKAGSVLGQGLFF